MKESQEDPEKLGTQGLPSKPGVPSSSTDIFKYKSEGRTWGHWCRFQLNIRRNYLTAGNLAIHKRSPVFWPPYTLRYLPVRGTPERFPHWWDVGWCDLLCLFQAKLQRRSHSFAWGFPGVSSLTTFSFGNKGLHSARIIALHVLSEREGKLLSKYKIRSNMCMSVCVISFLLFYFQEN